MTNEIIPIYQQVIDAINHWKPRLKKIKMTQGTLAEKAGVGQVFLSHIMSFKSDPKLSQFIVIEKIIEAEEKKVKQ